MLKGGKLLAFLAALLVTLMLAVVFIWRSTVSWQAVANGEPKTFAASLISAMFVASGLSLMRLLRARRALLSDAPDAVSTKALSNARLGRLGDAALPKLRI